MRLRAQICKELIKYYGNISNKVVNQGQNTLVEISQMKT